MSAGTRSRAMTATAPASSAMRAWSGVTTSMMTPPLSIWARPFLVAHVEVSTVVFATLSSDRRARDDRRRRLDSGVLARTERARHHVRADYRTRDRAPLRRAQDA